MSCFFSEINSCLLGLFFRRCKKSTKYSNFQIFPMLCKAKRSSCQSPNEIDYIHLSILLRRTQFPSSVFLKKFAATGDASIICFGGIPRTSTIRAIWSCSFWPANRASPVCISTRIQPENKRKIQPKTKFHELTKTPHINFHVVGQVE